MPFDPFAHAPPSRRRVFERIGSLALRDWRAKLYAAAGSAALRPENAAAARRAWGARIATVSDGAVAGFAMLRMAESGNGRVLSVYWWQRAMLHAAVLVLPENGRPQRDPAASDTVSCAAALELMGREAAAWRRCVLDTESPSLETYLATCCA